MGVDINKEIQLMNQLITQAVIHGGDPGGAYYINEEGLADAANEWLRFKGLDELYEFDPSVSVDHYDGTIYDFFRKKVVYEEGELERLKRIRDHIKKDRDSATDKNIVRDKLHKAIDDILQ